MYRQESISTANIFRKIKNIYIYIHYTSSTYFIFLLNKDVCRRLELGLFGIRRFDDTLTLRIGFPLKSMTTLPVVFETLSMSRTTVHGRDTF